MLVVTSKNGDQIQIPSAQISVRILSVGTRQVTLGIEAPADTDVIPVVTESPPPDAPRLRIDPSEPVATPKPKFRDGPVDPSGEPLSHQLRNHLNSVSMALHVIQSQLSNEQAIDRNLLDQAIKQLSELDH